jgi:integrase
MGRGINRLMPLQCAKSKKPMLCDGDGLWLKTKPAKGGGWSRSWLFRFQLDGVKDQMGFGSLHDRPLAAARAKRDEARRLLLEGINPKIERDRQRAEQRIAALPVTTFKQSAQAYIDAHEVGWRSAKHSAEWVKTLTQYAYPVFGDLPVGAITTDLVLRCLEPHWLAIPNTMARVRGRIESVLDWAKARGLRNGGDNPASWDILKHLLPKPSKVKPVVHHEALPFEEVPAFMAALRKIDGPAARALEFTILTAARAGESRLATWNEIDGDVWTIPGSRMKAGKPHTVPLCKRAMAILHEMRGLDREMIFPRHGGPAGLRRVLQRLGRDVTVHGFRSTFRDWCGARSNFPREVAEMALAHRIGNATENAYARSDLFEKRRRLMAAWCEFCTSTKVVGGKVLPMRA